MTQGKKAGRARREYSFLRLSLLGDERIGHSFPFFFFSFRSSCLSLPLSGGSWEEGERGAPLGLIISIGGRNRSFWKKPPLPWPFGPHVAVFLEIQDYTHRVPGRVFREIVAGKLKKSRARVFTIDVNPIESASVSVVSAPAP